MREGTQRGRGPSVRPWICLIAVVVATAAVAGPRAATARAADSSGNPVVAAAGDMACDPSDPKFNGGNGTTDHCGEVRTTNQLLTDPTIDEVLGLGDYQYSCDDPTDFALSYTSSWGRLNSIFFPAAGNHEYLTGTDSFGATCPTTNDTAQSYFSYFGPESHPDTGGHYSWNVGSWHLIALNANCAKTGVGGCGVKSAQTTWLKNDLSGNTQPCILAFWHQPRWTGEASNNVSVSAWWNLLYQYHADLILNGHVHNYQRFAKLNPSGVPASDGIREIIAGTGGDSEQGFNSSAAPQPEASTKLFGFLRLVLKPGSYDGSFVSASGTALDTFTGTCNSFSASAGRPAGR